MVLTYWWLGLSALICLIVVSVVVARRKTSRKTSSDTQIVLANLAELKHLPRYQKLARNEVKWVILECVSLLLAIFGGLFLVSKPIFLSNDSPEMKARDVMLCLDVSGSMSNVDQLVIESYLELIAGFDGERVGFIMWDSSAVTVFPLTDDYAYIDTQLKHAHQALGSSANDFLEGVRYGNGSSLIGDGLMSCISRFDQQQASRPRSIVFVTDNELSGKPFFSLKEAGNYAKNENILIYAITVNSIDATNRKELETVVKQTGGELLELGLSGFEKETIIKSIESQQKKSIQQAPSIRSLDLLWPGTLLMCLGLFGMTVAASREKL